MFVCVCVCVFTLLPNRLKRKADIVGAFKCDPLYLKHNNQDSGTFVLLEGILAKTDTNGWVPYMVNKQIFGGGTKLRHWRT